LRFGSDQDIDRLARAGGQESGIDHLHVRRTLSGLTASWAGSWQARTMFS
jgi:hypothetical protein